MANTESVKTQDYVIPTVTHDGMSMFWFILGTPAAFFCAGLLVSLDFAFSCAIYGFFIGVFVAFIYGFILASRLAGRQQKVWDDHSYTWYRATFPETINSKGRVECRHCGGNVHTKNLMNRTFMRVHVCDQCGETLYFSKEKR